MWPHGGRPLLTECYYKTTTAATTKTPLTWEPEDQGPNLTLMSRLLLNPLIPCVCKKEMISCSTPSQCSLNIKWNNTLENIRGVFILCGQTWATPQKRYRREKGTKGLCITFNVAMGLKFLGLTESPLSNALYNEFQWQLYFINNELITFNLGIVKLTIKIRIVYVHYINKQKMLILNLQALDS